MRAFCLAPAAIAGLLVLVPGHGLAFRGPMKASQPAARTTVDVDDRVDVNRLDMFVSNRGSFAFDAASYDAGLFYPRGTTNPVMYKAGLWLGAIANASTRVATVEELASEYVPGPMLGGFPQPDEPPFRNYRIERGNTTSEDYLNWPIAHGAPTDAQGHPLLLGDVTIWSVYNEADPNAHYFTTVAGGTAPLGVEVRQTTFAFDRESPLGRAVFLRFELLNRGYNMLGGMYVALWCDPDIGDYTDDLAGCDSSLALGYAYNADDQDPFFGTLPPAMGMVLLQGPSVSSGGGAPDTLGMTTFVRYRIEEHPGSGIESYHLMRGLQKSGAPVHVGNDPDQPVTTYQVSGDPLAGTGWLDGEPSDRHFMVSAGPFTMAVGDTQVIIAAILVGHGADRLASIADLRDVRAAAVDAYRSGFDVPDGSTAILMHLIDSNVSADRVSLRWYLPDGPAVAAVVERREPDTEWRQVSERLVPQGDVLRFEDRDVAPAGRYGYRLLAWNGLEQDRSHEIWVTLPPASSGVLALRPGYPNPSAGPSRWSFYLPREGRVRLTICNAQGRLVRVVDEGQRPAGWHEVDWEGKDQAGRETGSGLYFARLETVEGVVTRKIVLAR